MAHRFFFSLSQNTHPSIHPLVLLLPESDSDFFSDKDSDGQLAQLIQCETQNPSRTKKALPAFLSLHHKGSLCFASPQTERTFQGFRKDLYLKELAHPWNNTLLCSRHKTPPSQQNRVWTRRFSTRLSTSRPREWVIFCSVLNNCWLLRRCLQMKSKDLKNPDVGSLPVESWGWMRAAALTYGYLISPAHNIDWVKALTPNKSVAGVASLQGGQLLAWAGNFLMDCRKTRLVHWHASAALLNSIILSLELNYHLLVEADVSPSLAG